MKCPQCHCVFMRVLSPHDSLWGKPLMGTFFCPRCGKPWNAQECGAQAFAHLLAGMQHFANEVAAQQAPSKEGNA